MPEEAPSTLTGGTFIGQDHTSAECRDYHYSFYQKAKQFARQRTKLNTEAKADTSIPMLTVDPIVTSRLPAPR